MRYKAENLHRSSTLLETVTRNGIFNRGANGDIVLMAALTRFVCFCAQFDKASFHHLRVLKYENKLKRKEEEDKILDPDFHLQFYDVQDAFLGYNSCYDTLLQAIKFAFKLVGKIETEQDFLDALANCKWNTTGDAIGIKDLLIKSYLSQNSSFKNFLNKSISFFETKRNKSSKYANNIKHNGGIIFPSLKNYIPSVSKVFDVVFMERHSNGECRFNIQEKSEPFKMECLYPMTIDSTTAIQILNTQNESIYNYTIFLFDVLKYDQLKSGEYIFPFDSNDNIL